jgi:outer membrane protein assembly factor BamD (BamD/ComL family)
MRETTTAKAPLTTLRLTLAAIGIAMLPVTASAQIEPARVPATGPGDNAQTDAQAWEFRDGRWAPVPKAEMTVTSDADLDRAEETLQRGAARAARMLLVRWFRDPANNKSPLRDRATFLLAEAYFQMGNRILAFYHLDEVMDLYPESRLYTPSLQRQYDIAEDFLEGYKRRFLKMPILSAEDEAIEMLFRIQTRAPGSPLAEQALLRTADYYYATRQYDLAADSYAAYISAYPRSPLVPRAKLREAFSTLAQFRGTRFDATSLVNARRQFLELSAIEPELAASEDIESVIARIDSALALKIYQTGDFWRRTHQPRAAAFTWMVLQQSYPESPEAAEAGRRISQLPPAAVEQARAVFPQSGLPLPFNVDGQVPEIPPVPALPGDPTPAPANAPAPATQP